MYRGLIHLLEYEGNIEETFCRNFVVDLVNGREVVHYELIENGSSIFVTKENRESFAKLLVNWWLYDGIESQLNSIKAGFLKVCGGGCVRMLCFEELEYLICGSPVLKFEEIERNAKYENGYSRESPTIKMFWRILHSLSTEEKKKFLIFATGTDRMPFNVPLKLTISRNGYDENRLMSSHTCFNHILLPNYSKEEVMRSKVLIAIINFQGFGLR